MSKISRKRMAEIKAIRDEDIDTSDIPEVDDFSDFSLGSIDEEYKRIHKMRLEMYKAAARQRHLSGAIVITSIAMLVAISGNAPNWLIIPIAFLMLILATLKLVIR